VGKRIEDTIDGHDTETDDSDLVEEIISTTQKKFFQNGGSVQAHIHCECALVHYFNDPTVPLDQSTPPPMDYLGASKLSCNACARFIDASNKHSKRKFYTRGCHGKWCFPWAPPQSDQQVLRTFSDTMSSHIANLLVHQSTERRRRLSDSSCSSTDWEFGPDNDETDQANLVWAKADRLRRMGINGLQ